MSRDDAFWDKQVKACEQAREQQTELGEAYHRGLNDRQDEIDNLVNDLKLADESYSKLCGVNAKLRSDLTVAVEALESVECIMLGLIKCGECPICKALVKLQK